MIDNDAEVALLERAGSLPYALALPNEDADPDLPYVEVTIFRNIAQRLTVSGQHRRRGILQLTVCVRQGEGTRPAMQIAETVAAHFPVDLRLGHVRVTAAPTIAGGIPDDSQWRVPVSVPFETLT